MWFVFGTGAIISGILNLYFYFQGRNPKIFRFISLSLTTLTVWAFHYTANIWVLNKDISALEDVVPTMSKVLLVFSLFSIFINGITLRGKENDKKTKV